MTDFNENNRASAEAENRESIDLAYIFSQIKEIQNQTAYLNEVIDKLSHMTDGDSGNCGAPGNILGQAKAQALGDVVRCRETTNQKLLDFYISVYNDMTSESKVTELLQYHIQHMPSQP